MNYDALTDAQLDELLTLKREERFYQRRQFLLDYQSPDHNPNFRKLMDVRAKLKYIDKELVKGCHSGVVLEGSSRSGKTFAGVDFIIYLCIHLHKDHGVKIIIVRETYAEFKDTVYDDFKRRLDYYDLDNPFHRAKEIKSFKIGKSTIVFMGCDKIGKSHGAGSDYVFFNEMMSIDQAVFDQLEQRCRIMFWGDYNPSFTRHWVFDSVVPRSDVDFLRTTFKDNPFISAKERAKILAYEPWEPDTYYVNEEGQIIYNEKEVSDLNQPPPHPINIQEGTAKPFMWKCYGLGLRGAQEGLIHKNIVWIDEFPSIGYTYCTDFGFVNDPCSVNRYAEDESNIYIEPLIYQPIPTPEELDAAMVAVGMYPDVPNAADSSDVHMSEHGKIEMVRSLRNIGWEIFKISKTKGNYFWICSMNDKKIHIVKNHLYNEIKPETENYIWKTVNGIPINQPIDNFNHFWDSSKYGHMSHTLLSQTAETS